MDAPPQTGQDGAPAGELTATERAIFGSMSAGDVRGFLDSYVQQQLDSAIANVRFRAGRIDSVWGIDLDDGRAVVVKTYRQPMDLEASRTTREALRLLSGAGYPCPVPLSGPDEIDGQVLTAETLLSGALPDGRRSGNRRVLAAGLARHIALLRQWPELTPRAGAGPSWCRYQQGPWPVPHDTIVDFSSTRPGYTWLDDFGRQAAEQILRHRDAHEVVLGHADWYAGNTLVEQGELVGTFDWELVADTEAAIAGFAAACFASSPTAGGGLSTPEEAAAFMRDYDDARGEQLSSQERLVAGGAAAWILAFNARWQVALIDLGLADHQTVALVEQRRGDYLSLTW